jgi:hypothetical protein
MTLVFRRWIRSDEVREAAEKAQQGMTLPKVADAALRSGGFVIGGVCVTDAGGIRDSAREEASAR